MTRDEWRILYDDQRAAAAGDDDAYRKAKKRLHDVVLDDLRAMEEACDDDLVVRASMTRRRLALEKVYEADDEERPDGPEFDELNMVETEALDALADTPCKSLKALFLKDYYLRLKSGPPFCVL
jgi:hypothetical protein